MIDRFGLKINIDEARVLMASVDKDNSGDLAMDEFMELIFNDSDILNVNLKELLVLTDKEKDLLLSD